MPDRKTPDRPSLKIRLAALSLGLGIGLIAGEIGFRIYYANDFGPPTHRNWYFKKTWYDQYEQLNGLGHRDHEFSVQKPAGVYRIMVVGDSITYGQGVEYIDDLLTEVLERRLNDTPSEQAYEVLNIAKSGWGAEEHLQALRDFVPSYQPDLILIQFFINDIEVDWEDRPDSLQIVPQFMHEFLSRVSYMYWYLYDALNRSIKGEQFLDYMLRYSQEQSRHWQGYVAYIDEIVRYCRDNELPLGFALTPVLTTFEPDRHPFSPVYERVAKLLESKQVPAIDLFPAFIGQTPSDFWVGATDPHPNEAAQRIYADAIHDFVQTEFLPR